MRASKLWRAIRNLSLGALGIGAALWALRGSSGSQLLVSLRGLSGVWLFLFLLSVIGGTALRALRLAWVCGPQVRYPTAWASVAIGYATGSLMPLGSGELAKVAVLHNAGSTTTAQALAAVAMDRLFDLLSLLLLLLGLVLLRRELFPPTLRLALPLALALIATAVLLLWKRRDALVAWLETRRTRVRLLDSLRRHLLGVARHLLARIGLATHRNLVGLQMAILAIDTFTIGCGLHAMPFGAKLPPVASALCTNALLMVSAALPLLPGNLGGHQAASVVALGMWGLGKSEAIAFSVATQGLYILCVLGLGMIALAFLGWSPRHLADDMAKEERARDRLSTS